MDERIKAYVDQPAFPPPLREADLAALARRRRERLELGLTGAACALWALTMAAACLLLSSLFGIPVSTTHTKTSAIMGVGAVKRLSAINFGVVKDMMLTWVFTFPGCGLISFVMAKIFTAIF